MKVTEYVDLRIKNLREENPGQVVRFFLVHA